MIRHARLLDILANKKEKTVVEQMSEILWEYSVQHSLFLSGGMPDLLWIVEQYLYGRVYGDDIIIKINKEVLYCFEVIIIGLLKGRMRNERKQSV